VRELPEQAAHPAAGGGDDDGLAADDARGAHECERGTAIRQQRHRGGDVDALRDAMQVGNRGQRARRIAATTTRGGDNRCAHPSAVEVVADRRDTAADAIAEHQRKLVGVEWPRAASGADLCVDEGRGRHLDGDEHLTRGGRRVRELDELEDGRGARSRGGHCVHGTVLARSGDIRVELDQRYWLHTYV
jgi:hypothetical protein